MNFFLSLLPLGYRSVLCSIIGCVVQPSYLFFIYRPFYLSYFRYVVLCLSSLLRFVSSLLPLGYFPPARECGILTFLFSLFLREDPYIHPKYSTDLFYRHLTIAFSSFQRLNPIFRPRFSSLRECPSIYSISRVSPRFKFVFFSATIRLSFSLVFSFWMHRSDFLYFSSSHEYIYPSSLCYIPLRASSLLDFIPFGYSFFLTSRVIQAFFPASAFLLMMFHYDYL